MPKDINLGTRVKRFGANCIDQAPAPMKPKHRFVSTSSRDLANKLMHNPDDCGRTQYSKAHRKFMPPTKTRRIDPASPEGQAIAQRYGALSRN